MAVTTATIKSNGVVMYPGFELLSVDVTKEFNKVPIAELRLIDGDVAKDKFVILDGDFFEHGKEIEIALRYEGNPEAEETVFVGIVVNQGLELNGSGTTLLVEMSDVAVKMTSVRRNAIFANKADSDIIKALIGASKLTVGKVAPTTLKHPEMVQYYSSDWDFMLSRAEANGHLVLVDDGVVSIVEPKIGAPGFALELGIDTILDFDLQINGLKQLDEVSSMGWDITKQQLTRPAKGDDFKLSQGNFSASKIAKAVGGEEATLVHPVALHPNELKSWADAQVTKSRLSLLRGWFRIPGNPKLKVGQTIEIKGVSKRFSGKNIITGVRHQVTPGNWETHIQIGMDASWFASETRVVDTQAAGLLPGVNGLQIGVVTAFEKDPHNEFRVRVNIPAFDPRKGMVWARWAAGDAGKQRGLFFRPEVGDEVVVGFLNDDPRQAIVLGAMHSSANQPPIVPSAENGPKGIVTKNGYRLIFDEEEETIVLETSSQNSISINEKHGIITILDGNDNCIEMSKEGILLDSAKDILIASKGDFEIAAKGNVKIGGKKVDLI